jgi:hypothetical protein
MDSNKDNFGDDVFARCKKKFTHVPTKIILSSIEELVETNGKERDMVKYLRIFEEQSILKRSELFKYLIKPQYNKKGSPEFKKKVNEYFFG